MIIDVILWMRVKWNVVSNCVVGGVYLYLRVYLCELYVVLSYDRYFFCFGSLWGGWEEIYRMLFVMVICIWWYVWFGCFLYYLSVLVNSVIGIEDFLICVD